MYKNFLHFKSYRIEDLDAGSWQHATMRVRQQMTRGKHPAPTFWENKLALNIILREGTASNNNTYKKNYNTYPQKKYA
jgi:hypothetical protein